MSDSVGTMRPRTYAAILPAKWRDTVLLMLVGLCLTLIQYTVLNEAASLVGTNDVVVLLVACAYFLGLSVGYVLSDSLPRAAVVAMGLSTFALLLTLPFSARWMAGSLARINLAGNIPPFVFLLVLIGITPFFAVFLPRMIDSEPGGPSALARLYGTELLGAFAGLAILAILTPAHLDLILAVNLAALSTLLLFAFRAPGAMHLGSLSVAGVYVFAYPGLDRASLEYFYRWTRDFEKPRVIATAHSPYQRIDLIAEAGEVGRPYLYLDANLLYGTTRLNQHNLFVSVLPNLLYARKTANVCVLGGGSLDSVRFLTPRVGKLRVVEIDETVVRLTREHIQRPRGNFPEAFDLVIDDGKHFLGNYAGTPFDVIAVDIPVPTHIQTAMLHSERFFNLAKTRMTPDGVFAISLAGKYQFRSPSSDWLAVNLPNRIAAGLHKAFKHVVIIRVGSSSYAWASEAPIVVSAPLIRRTLRAFYAETHTESYFGAPEAEVLAPDLARVLCLDFDPIGEADMQLVLKLSVSKLYERYYDRDD